MNSSLKVNLLYYVQKKSTVATSANFQFKAAAIRALLVNGSSCLTQLYLASDEESAEWGSRGSR